MEKLNFEDKLNFDFAFDPKRDRKLVAKRARKYFSDDKVFSFLLLKVIKGL